MCDDSSSSPVRGGMASPSLSGRGRLVERGARAGPALEGAGEGGGVGEAEAVGRLLDRDAFGDEADGEAAAQGVEHFLEGDALGLEAAVEGLSAVAERAGDRVDPERA